MTVTVGDLTSPATITPDKHRPNLIHLAGPLNGQLTTEQALSVARAIQHLLKEKA